MERLIGVRGMPAAALQPGTLIQDPDRQLWPHCEGPVRVVRVEDTGYPTQIRVDYTQDAPEGHEVLGCFTASRYRMVRLAGGAR